MASAGDAAGRSACAGASDTPAGRLIFEQRPEIASLDKPEDTLLRQRVVFVLEKDHEGDLVDPTARSVPDGRALNGRRSCVCWINRSKTFLK